jgi:hypothetical protein
MRPPFFFHPRRSFGIALAMGAALVTVSACNLHLGSGIEARDTWTRTYTVEPGAMLDVRETNGRVRVEAIEGDRVEVTATRIARAPTEEAAKQALKDITISETATADRVELDSTTRGLQLSLHRSRSVHYDIKVPRSMHVTVKTTNGEVDVRGIAGVLRVEAVNGAISGADLGAGAEVTSTNGRILLEFARLDDTGVRCKTTNGQIVVTVPASAKATIAARVTNGRIGTENLQMQATEESRRRLDATIGGGGPEIRLDTVNGEIRVVGK